jgi:biotin/methionine sulfoxide reductase
MTTLLGTHFGTYEVAAGGQSLRGFRHDPAPSPLGAGLLELAGHEVRVRAPMVRAGWLDHGPGGGRRGAEPFVPVDWDTALDLVAGELERVRRAHGNAAIFGGSYGWASAGRFHHAQSQLKRFLNLLGGFTYSVNSYSYGAAGVLLPHVLGALHAEPTVSAPSWDQITEHTGVMLAFGGLRPGNSQMEAGGVGRHTVLAWLGRAVARGMELIVVSPNRDDIPPGIAARHLPIRPNTDTALMLAMAQVLLEDGLVDHDFLARCTAGADRFLAYVSGAADGVAKTPDWAAPICGVPAGVIRDLAPRLCRERSLLNLSWSLQRAQHGEQPFWAAVALACLAGQIGLPGGGFAFGLGAVNSVGRCTGCARRRWRRAITACGTSSPSPASPTCCCGRARRSTMTGSA